MRIVLKLAFLMLAALLAQPAAYAQGKSHKKVHIPEAEWMSGKSKAPAKKKTARKAPPPRPFTPTMAGTEGWGPLLLTSSAAVTYQEYFAHACPLVLTVEAAGWNTYGTFGAANKCPKGAVSPETVRSALNACSSYAANPPCSVVAIGSRVVWNGPISFLPGRYTPKGDDQFSIVLRKIAREDALPTGFDTAVGLVTYTADGGSGDIRFQRDHDLGECRGKLSRSDGAPATVALTCTKLGAVDGTLELNADGHTGAGTATGKAGRQFALTVLPHAAYMTDGPALPTPGAKTTKPERSEPTS